MIVISPQSLSDLMQSIVQTAMSGVDHHGQRQVLKTMDPAALRGAALAALTLATGDVVWPADKILAKQRDERLVFVKEVG